MPIILRDSDESTADSEAEAAAAEDPPRGIKHSPLDFLRFATHVPETRDSWFDFAMEDADLVKGRAPASDPTVLVIARRRRSAALLLKDPCVRLPWRLLLVHGSVIDGAILIFWVINVVVFVKEIRCVWSKSIFAMNKYVQY
jgi:hypothetical protein